jgi:hypothetical protein
MSQDLNDFFKLLAEDKKKKKEEFDSVVGDLGLDTLFSEFATLKKKEKEKKVEEQKEQESIIGEITLDSLFSEVANLKKETKKKKIQEEKTVKAFEKWLYSETPKEQEQIIENVIEQSLDEVLEVLEDHKEEPKEDLIEKSLGLLAEPSNVKQQQDPITPLDQKFATLDDLHKHYSTFLSRIQQQLSTIGGGGETKLRYLDDVVGIATNSGAYNGKYLQWNSATNRAEFTDPSDSETITIVSVTGVTTYYQATNTDDYIGVNANVPVIIQLPPSPITGKKLIVKDEGNKIATYNITVQTGAGTSVENNTSVIMSINHQSLTYFYNGSNWFLI